MISDFQNQTRENIFKFLQRMGRTAQVYSDLRSAGTPHEDLGELFIYAHEDEVVVVAIDAEADGMEELADEKHSDIRKPPLYFTAETFRESPVWHLSVMVGLFRQVLASLGKETVKVWGVLLTGAHIMNRDEMAAEWDQMSVTVIDHVAKLKRRSMHLPLNADLDLPEAAIGAALTESEFTPADIRKAQLGVGKAFVPTSTEQTDSSQEPRFSFGVSILKDFDHSHYCNGPATVDILCEDKELPKTDRFKCSILGPGFFPMCSTTSKCRIKREGNWLSYEMESSRLWMPGSYTLLILDNNELLARLDFQLDEQLETQYGELQHCPLLGEYDVLINTQMNDAGWLRLANTPGTGQMLQTVMHYRQLSVYNQLRNKLGANDVRLNCNFLLATRNQDWTEQTVRDFMQQVAYDYTLDYTDCSTLYDTACNNPYEHLNELLTSCTGKRIICLTGISPLLATGGKMVVRKLLDYQRQAEAPVLIWLCGTEQELESLLEVFPSLGRLYTRDSWIRQQPYSAFELTQAFIQQLACANLEPTAELKDQAARAIVSAHASGALAGWTVDDLRRMVAEDICPRYVRRIMADINFREVPPLSTEDVDLSLFTTRGATFDDCIRELNQMVGLDDIKQAIATMANNTRFYQERRRRGLPTKTDECYHSIFTGNPGTGKTTVARMLGKIYRSLGLLSRGEVIAVDRARLVGRFIGETEDNMKSLLEEARGNVLFIDEAYTLYDGAVDRKDYGHRVLETLLTVLSRPNPDMLIIFAGYEKQMDAMLTSNPGLMGRFPYKYRFSDYSAEQLMQIACQLLEADAYILTDGARDLLNNCIVQTLAQRTPNFGNARWVEQFVRNGIIPAMANRVTASAADDYQHIEADDVERAYQRFNPRMTELKPRRKAGFSV